MTRQLTSTLLRLGCALSECRLVSEGPGSTLLALGILLLLLLLLLLLRSK